MKNKKYVVYCHTNKINGKRYVGITCQKPTERWKNGRGYIGCTEFYNAILKYGWEEFSHEILFENLTKEEAEQKEIYLIEKWQLTNSKQGYNLALGGLINYPTEEMRKKLSDANRGKPSWNKGKCLTDKHRKKLSEAKKDFTPSNKKNILCVETGKVYKSITDASKDTNADRSNISAVCNGRLRKTKGLHFRFIANECRN